jgi:hypothetical protein
MAHPEMTTADRKKACRHWRRQACFGVQEVLRPYWTQRLPNQ